MVAILLGIRKMQYLEDFIDSQTTCFAFVCFNETWWVGDNQILSVAGRATAISSIG